MTAISTPASGGPRRIVRRFAAWKSAVALATSPCSSPTSSGTTARCTPMYGAMKTPLAATSASRTGNGSSPSECSRGIAPSSGTRARSQISIVRRVPMTCRDRAAPEAEQRDRDDLRDQHPRHLLRRARRRAARTRAARARSSACRATRSPRRRAARRGGGRGAGSCLGCRAEADHDRLRASARAAAAELVEQLPRSARRAPRARAASARTWPTRSASRGASAGRARARAAARRAAAAAAGRRARRAARSPRARRRRTRSGSRPRATALAPGALLALLDEAPLAERAQVVAARRRAVADDERALGRGRLVDRMQVVEQREPGRVGERAHRARVGQGEGAIERDLSKLIFREPGVKDPLLLLAVEARGRIGGRLAAAHPVERVARRLRRADACAGRRRPRARPAC